MNDLAEYTDNELANMLHAVHQRQDDALEELTVAFIACSLVSDRLLDEMNRRKQ